MIRYRISAFLSRIADQLDSPYSRACRAAREHHLFATALEREANREYGDKVEALQREMQAEYGTLTPEGRELIMRTLRPNAEQRGEVRWDVEALDRVHRPTRFARRLKAVPR